MQGRSQNLQKISAQNDRFWSSNRTSGSARQHFFSDNSCNRERHGRCRISRSRRCLKSLRVHHADFFSFHAIDFGLCGAKFRCEKDGSCQEGIALRDCGFFCHRHCHVLFDVFPWQRLGGNLFFRQQGRACCFSVSQSLCNRLFVYGDFLLPYRLLQRHRQDEIRHASRNSGGFHGQGAGFLPDEP